MSDLGEVPLRPAQGKLRRWGSISQALYHPKTQRVFILAMLPHQREEPNTAFTNPEIGGGEGHV